MAAGEEVAGFSEYVAARQAALLRTAYLLTGHRQDAEDLVQTTLVKVVPHWSKLHGNLDGYVRTVMVRESVSRWRRRRWREVLGADHAEPVVDHEGSDARLDLQHALAALAPKQRAVIVLRYLEDLSVAETAAALGVAEGTVKTQTRDALARLRQLLPDLQLDDQEPSGTLVP